MLRTTLDDAFLQTRLNAKYGIRRRRRTDPVAPSEGTTTVRFLATPPPVRRMTTVDHVLRAQRIDQRRVRLLEPYTNNDPQQQRPELDNATPVPAVLARSMGGRRVSAETLLAEVARATPDLTPNARARLVADMCADVRVAREWIACFGDD